MIAIVIALTCGVLAAAGIIGALLLARRERARVLEQQQRDAINEMARQIGEALVPALTALRSAMREAVVTFSQLGERELELAEADAEADAKAEGDTA